jgi:hypothetical protein
VRIGLGILSAALLASTLMMIPPNALACNEHGNCNHDKHHGAPGPIVGAGLPVLAIGYGVYWLVKRRRKTD